MGMDVAFNRAQALAAGLEVFRDTNGTQEDIDRAIAYANDPEYLVWLKRTDEFIRVPGTEFATHSEGDEFIIVRANKWGDVYAPLTTWLKAHNIEWEEF